MIIKKIKPLFTTVITTMNRFEKDIYKNGMIVNREGEVDMFQEVLEVGDCVKGIKKGDLVHIDPIRYGILKHDVNSIKNDGTVKSYNIPTITICDKPCFKLQQSDIDYVVEEWENENEDNKVLSLKDSIIK